MRKIYVFMMVFFLLPLTLLFSEEEKVYFASRLTEEPLLDGKLNDPAWRNIKEAGNFIIHGTTSLAAKQTSFKIGYNDVALYIGIKCEEPEVDKIMSNEGHTDFTNLWNEDSVEIFMFPEGAESYYQFVVSSIGSRWNGIGRGGPKIPLLDWQANSYKGKDFYSIEVKFPFEIFYTAPAENERWRMNVARNIYTPSGEKKTCWPYLKAGFHDLDNFGELIFPGKVSKEKIRLMVASHFREKISANLRTVSDLSQKFSEKKTDTLLKRKIDLFLRDYQKIEKNLSGLETLSIKEMKLLLKESEELIPKAEELKQKILLKSFF